MHYRETKHMLVAVAAAALVGACTDTGIDDEEGIGNEQGALSDERLGEQRLGDAGLADDDLGDDARNGIGAAESDDDAGFGDDEDEVEVAAADYPAFGEVDADDDGSLTQDELDTVRNLDLEALDADGDRLVSETEYSAAQ